MGHRNGDTQPSSSNPHGRSPLVTVADRYQATAKAKLEANADYPVPDRDKVHRISINAATVVGEAEKKDQPTKLGTVPGHDDVRWADLFTLMRSRSNKVHSKPLGEEAPAGGDAPESNLQPALDFAAEVISRAVTAVDGNNSQDEEVKKKHATLLETVPAAPSRPAFQEYLEGLKARIEASGDEELVELVPLIDAALTQLGEAVAGTPGRKSTKAPVDERAAILALHLALGDLLRAGATRATKARLGFLKQAITPRRGTDQTTATEDNANTDGQGGDGNAPAAADPKKS